MAGLVEVLTAVAVVVATVFGYIVLKLLWNGVWKPLRLRRVMAQQGVKGAPFRFLVGNLDDIRKFADSFPEALPLGSYADFSPTVTPQYALFCPKYGKNFVYEWATSTRLVVRDPEIAKEIFVDNHRSLKKFPFEMMLVRQVMGVGISSLVGEKWSTERRTLTPFFHQDALKGMVEAMVEATTTGIQKWEKMVATSGGLVEIDVEPDIHKISVRTISLTAFGGDCDKGEQIYELQKDIAIQVMKSLRNPLYWLIPNYRKIPTKANKYIAKCRSKIDALLHEALDERRDAMLTGKASSYGEDLLGHMLSAAIDGWDEQTQAFNLASVFNNCKLFYFAGHETVAITIVFSMMLLANHPQWQDNARREVLEVLGDRGECNYSTLARLKVVGMIINETLRIFSPASSMARQTIKDLQLKGLFIPKGMTIEVASIAIHHDRDYWGDDVMDFNPERFNNGVSGACSHPHAFMPFGLGPKSCIGNNFAFMEIKIMLAMVLQRFQLAISPNYQHHPTFNMVLRPKFGVPLILKAL